MYTKLKSNELGALRTKLQKWCNPTSAGAARAATHIVISEVAENQPVLVMNFGNEAIALNKDGAEIVDEKTSEGEDGSVIVVEKVTRDARKMTRGWHVPLSNVVDPGSVPTNKMLGDLRIPCGVVLVIGGAATAKTPMVHALASASVEEYAIVRYGEPLAGYIVDARDAAVALGAAMIRESDIVFDSIKDLLAYAPGGAMASGLSRGSLPVLSDLSAMASSVGCTIYVPLNPSTPNEDVVTMLVEAAKSNVAMVVTTVSVNEKLGTANWTALIRRGEGLVRDLVTFESHFDKESVLHIGSSATNKGRVVRTASAVSGAVGVDALDGLLRRHSI